MTARIFMSLAAIAIFVGLAAPVHASVDYTSVKLVIPNNGSYSVDFNHDLAEDLSIGSSLSAVLCADGGSGTSGSVIETPAQPSTSVVSVGIYPAALPAGVSIHSRQSFIKGQAIKTHFSYGCQKLFVIGNWFNVNEQFLGVQFQIDGQTHYGWVELSTKAVSSPRAALTTTVIGFAYETIPDKPIITGATGLQNAVTIEAPVNGSSVGSPVHVHATYNGTVTATYMKLWVDHVPGTVQSHTNVFDTYVTLANGNHLLEVQASDPSTGKVYTSATNIGVGSGRCTPSGSQCSPFSPCCPGLVCVAASTRAFCQRSSGNTPTTSSYWNHLNGNKLE